MINKTRSRTVFYYFSSIIINDIISEKSVIEKLKGLMLISSLLGDIAVAATHTHLNSAVLRYLPKYHLKYCGT